MTTHYFVCIAGFSEQVVNEIRSRPAARFTGAPNNNPIIYDLRPPFIYDINLARKFLVELTVRVKSIPLRDSVGIILVYAEHRADVTNRFVREFFPFALAVSAPPFYPETSEKWERRRRLLEAVDHIENVISEARGTVRAVWDYLAGNNFSPLLLPLRNFHSDVLIPVIRMLFEGLSHAQDSRSLIKTAANEILFKHPQKRDGYSRYFEDDRQLQFFSPGRDRHAFARVLSKGHRPSCLLNSRVRFGGKFDALFHYDCQAKHRGLDGSYPNCHDAECRPAAETHVNIAPNDFVR